MTPGLKCPQRTSGQGVQTLDSLSLFTVGISVPRRLSFLAGEGARSPAHTCARPSQSGSKQPSRVWFGGTSLSVAIRTGKIGSKMGAKSYQPACRPEANPICARTINVNEMHVLSAIPSARPRWFIVFHGSLLHCHFAVPLCLPRESLPYCAQTVQVRVVSAQHIASPQKPGSTRVHQSEPIFPGGAHDQSVNDKDRPPDGDRPSLLHAPSSIAPG